jgi:holo-[acyl-carrier protein] synthase
MDVVEIDRIREIHERHGERFVRRICRVGETRYGPERPGFAAHLAGLFAAKEAVMKALGSGWSKGVVFRDVEISRDDAGAPSVRLHGGAGDLARIRRVAVVHVSITHERSVAAAVAVLES